MISYDQETVKARVAAFDSRIAQFAGTVTPEQLERLVLGIVVDVEGPNGQQGKDLLGVRFVRTTAQFVGIDGVAVDHPVSSIVAARFLMEGDDPEDTVAYMKENWTSVQAAFDRGAEPGASVEVDDESEPEGSGTTDGGSGEGTPEGGNTESGSGVDQGSDDSNVATGGTADAGDSASQSEDQGSGGDDGGDGGTEDAGGSEGGDNSGDGGGQEGGSGGFPSGVSS